MKILVLTRLERRVSFDAFYAEFGKYVDLELVKLGPANQYNLRRFLKAYDLGSYDRILVDLKWKRIRRQAKTLARIPNLVLYEQDAWQEYVPHSRNYRTFVKFYRKLPTFRFVTTSYHVAERLQVQGFDVAFLSKGYDAVLLRNLHLERSIPFGFIGRLKSKAYHERNRFLDLFKEALGLLIMRTESKAEYLERLNQIRVFVSADAGFGEYMFKNFEAMACGCLLLAYRQGREDEFLGFRDMENVVLYGSVEEALDKLRLLEKTPGLIDKIAAAGQALAEKNFTFAAQAQQLRDIMQPAIRTRQQPGSSLGRFFKRLWKC